jgi:restriction system protein
MAHNWKDYQEEAAAFFRALGLDAQTDVHVQGVRTHHDVDVVVRSHHVGFDVVWLVECKHWQTRVSKLHVLALREIVADVGADRGILLSEVGFQSGALEAATLTNVRATSLATLKQTASADIFAMRLRELHDRTQTCKQRYWDIPKDERIQRGLRPEVGTVGYSGARAVEFAEELLAKTFRGVYPIECDSLSALVMLGGPREFATPEEVLTFLEPMIGDLEGRLLERSSGTGQ